MYKGNWKFKNARTSPYDGTESRDTTPGYEPGGLTVHPPPPE